MKRLKNIWKKAVDIDNCIEAIIEGTRFKRGQRAVQWLLYSPEQVEKDKTLWHRIDKEKASVYAESLCKQLSDHTWQHKPPRYKRQFCRNRASSRGKWRDLYIPELDDHIIAHMAMQASMPAFMKGMHPYSCGSIPGRGIKCVNSTIKRWFMHDKACRYFVKLDIKKFFDNIDRNILVAVLESKIADEDILWIFRQIIDSAPGPCPVGYYTSPWLANLYLEKLDWFVEQQLYKIRRGKRIKYVRHYLRYVDDILLVGTSKRDLEKAISAIKSWLMENRKLEIKDSWEIKQIGRHETAGKDWTMRPNTYWCDMGGYKFSKDSTILRDGIFLETRRLARRISKQKQITVHQAISINSRLGWASHCDSHGFIRHEIEPYINIQTTRRIIQNVDQIRK